MTFQKAKPSRIFTFCINFFEILRYRKNVFNGPSRSETEPPEAPWGPHFMLPRRPLGDLIFHLSKFMLLRRFLRHVGPLLVLSWRPSEPSCRPPTDWLRFVLKFVIPTNRWISESKYVWVFSFWRLPLPHFLTHDFFRCVL